MPVQLSYPGVYIQEIPSGVRTITGVATSITAFIGKASRGPTNEATTINSYADFERIFGGLWEQSALGHAVRDFYLNGGTQAIIINLAGEGATPAALTLGTWTLKAAYPGTWGNNLRVRVDHLTRPPAPGEAADSLFNLFVRDTKTGQIEEFRNVSITPGHPRQVDNVLKNESNLVRAEALPTQLPPKSNDAQPGKDVWGDNEPATNYKVTTDGHDGGNLTKANDFTPDGAQAAKKGLYALEQVDLFNLLCIPPYTDGNDVETALLADAAAYCETRRAMLLVDPPSSWTSVSRAIGDPTASPPTGVAAIGTNSINAAVFFPRLKKPNPLRDNQIEDFAPCGAVAGIFARTDAQRGVWKAPAGLEADLRGVPQLSLPLTDLENGQLNQLGINCLRTLPAAGRVVWGARTLRGSDRLASEWKYIPVRRTALFIEESLFRGTQWVVFEPNDEPLWSQIRLNVGAFMHNLFRQGAFQGKTPREAYFVRCDKETTTQNDIDLGIVNIVVGFAPLKPAEFVVIQIQQIAGQIQV